MPKSDVISFCYGLTIPMVQYTYESEISPDPDAKFCCPCRRLFDSVSTTPVTIILYKFDIFILLFSLLWCCYRILPCEHSHMLPFMLPSVSSSFFVGMRVLLAGGRRVEVKVVGDVGVGEGDGVAARAEDAGDGGVGARGKAAEKKPGLTGDSAKCQGCQISYSS